MIGAKLAPNYRQVDPLVGGAAATDRDRGGGVPAFAVAHAVGKAIGAAETDLGRVDDLPIAYRRRAVGWLGENRHGEGVAIGVAVVGGDVDGNRATLTFTPMFCSSGTDGSPAATERGASRLHHQAEPGDEVLWGER